MFYRRYRLLRCAKENTILFYAGCVSPFDARYASLARVERPLNRLNLLRTGGRKAWRYW